MPSFSTSLSGLNANSEALSVIANNLANLNTVAYKGSSANFSDLFYQQVGTTGQGNPIQIGVGSTISSITSPFTQGNINSTGVPTDVAIQGDGFFMADKDGMTVYTRAGNFSQDENGFLVTDDGGFVLGYPAVNGVVNPGQTLAPMSVSSGRVIPANATTNFQIAMNLNASAAVGSVAGSYSTSIQTYDSLGTTHVLTFNFTKTAAGTWDYEITIPGADVGQANPVTVQTGTLQFDGAGRLISPAANVAGVSVTNLADGANDLNLTWGLYDSTGASTITQVAGPSAVSTTQQDGYPSGTLQSFSIGSDGIINGVLSNGQTTILGQIALANFPNIQGLTRAGANNFLASLSSGLPNVGAPGTGGRGALKGGALEQSNVDIATEFTKLILAERGYQANSRAITTADEITQDAINLKR
jgi:flagellar hook protein FlgE